MLAKFPLLACRNCFSVGAPWHHLSLWAALAGLFCVCLLVSLMEGKARLDWKINQQTQEANFSFTLPRSHKQKYPAEHRLAPLTSAMKLSKRLVHLDISSLCSATKWNRLKLCEIKHHWYEWHFKFHFNTICGNPTDKSATFTADPITRKMAGGEGNPQLKLKLRCITTGRAN